MTIEEIKKRVEGLPIADDELAHAREDDIHQDVLGWIAVHCADENCKELAREAMKTRNYDFKRSCA